MHDELYDTDLFDLSIEELEERIGELNDLWTWEGDHRAKLNLEIAEEILEFKRHGDPDESPWASDALTTIMARQIQMDIDNEIIKSLVALAEKEESE